MIGHPLCNQTVSIYSCSPEGISRRVVTGCFYRWHREQMPDGLEETKFLLILPAGESVQIGDRIYDGVGPAQVVWETFLPVNTPGLSQVAYVTPFVFQGRLHHTEAGRK
jgi:hypothetical protein